MKLISRGILLAAFLSAVPVANGQDCDSEHDKRYRNQATRDGPTCELTSLGDAVCAVALENSTRIQFYASDPVYYGWRTFKTYCHACHAEHNTGKSSAIVDVIIYQRSTEHTDAIRETFSDVVFNGRHSAGAKLAMPPWRSHPTVSRQVDDVYAYVRARAECKLPHLEHSRLKRCGTAGAACETRDPDEAGSQ